MFKHLSILLLIFISGVILSAGEPKYIFIFIGDGMGSAQVRSGELAKRKLSGKSLSFQDFPVQSSLNTNNFEDAITDSAAGATALFCGIKTKNGYLAMDSQGNAVPSVLQYAKKTGKSVGVVTSVQLNDATPAAIYAKVPSRKMYDEILLDFPDSGVDVLIGEKPLSGKLDAVEFMTKNQISVIDGDLAKFRLLPILPKPIYAQFTVAPAKERAFDLHPSLRDMLGMCIVSLSDNENGFVIMAEGGRIDRFCHRNDFASMLFEVLDFSDAVELGKTFMALHPEETLILVTADHETGGLQIDEEKLEANQVFAKIMIDGDKKYPKDGIEWSSKGSHSSTPVPFFATGARAEEFIGISDNTEVGKKLIKLLQKPAEITD